MLVRLLDKSSTKRHSLVDTIDYPETTLETDVTTALIKPIDSRENVTDYTAADPLRVIPNKEILLPNSTCCCQ